MIWLSSSDDKPPSPSSSTTWLLPVRKAPVMPIRIFKEKMGAVLVQFTGYFQHDAQEFLRHFLSRIHSEMKALYKHEPLPRPKPGGSIRFVRYSHKTILHLCMSKIVLC